MDHDEILPFDLEQIQAAPEICDTVPIKQARNGFALLGFQELAGPKASGMDNPVYVWVHPRGVMATAEEHEGRLVNVRAAALVDLGWKQNVDANTFRFRACNTCQPDGTTLVNATVAADTPGERTIGTFLAGLASTGKPLLGFGHWVAQARANQANAWLFCVGTDRLQRIEQDVSIQAWLQGAPEDLVQYCILRERQSHTAGYDGTLRDLVCSHTEKFIRKQGQIHGPDVPSQAQRDTLLRWVGIAEGKVPQGRKADGDEVLGMMLPHILTQSISRGCAQDRLLSWLKNAPVRLVEQLCNNPLPDGESWFGTLVDTVVWEQTRQVAMGNLPLAGNGSKGSRNAWSFAMQALDTVALRIGTGPGLTVELTLEKLTRAILAYHKTNDEHAGLGKHFIENACLFLDYVRDLQKRAYSDIPALGGIDVRQWQDALTNQVPSLNTAPLIARMQAWQMEDASLAPLGEQNARRRIRL